MFYLTYEMELKENIDPSPNIKHVHFKILTKPIVAICTPTFHHGKRIEFLPFLLSIKNRRLQYD